MNYVKQILLFFFVSISVLVPATLAQTVSEAEIPSVKVITPVHSAKLQTITLSGSMEALADVKLFSKVSGFLELLNVDIGDLVTKGDLIAKISLPETEHELSELEAAVRTASFRLELEKLTSQRLKDIRKKEPGAVTQQDVDEAVAISKIAEAKLAETEASLKKTKAILQYAIIRAPFNGVITERYVDVGDFIQSATGSKNVTPIARIMNIETIRIFVNVPEINFLMVSKGTQATIKIDALPGQELNGKVTRFSRVLSLESRTMKTEIDIANPDFTLRPGMFAYVTLFLESSGHSLTIPSDAISFLNEQPVVYIVRDNIVHAQKISIGFDDGSLVEIVDGLAINDQVVVSGKERLKEGIRVRFRIESQ